MSTCNQRSKATELFALLAFLFATFSNSSHGYETLITSEKESNFLVFDASLSDGGRIYSIGDGPRGAVWTERIFKIDRRSGSVVAKVCSDGQHLLYLKSRTHRLNAEQITTVILPLYVTLACGNASKSVSYKPSDFIRETAVSVVLNHRLFDFNRVCYKKSQILTSVKSVIPKHFLEKCDITYRTTDDELFAIEKRNGHLAVVGDVCFHNPWFVSVSFEMHCPGDRTSSKHSILFEFLPKGDEKSAFEGGESPKRVKRQISSRFGGNRPPHFDRPLYAVSVPEEQEKGFVVTTMNAKDPEEQAVDYSILAVLDSRSQHMFEIDVKSGVVKTSTKLDREFMDMHYFRVIAVDEGILAQTATTTLQIRVQDLNDHMPTFEQNIYETTVKESVPIGTIVVTVRATDKDSGNNAKIMYSILNPGGLNEAFSIDKDTGVMVTKQKLDREYSDYYSVKVQAVDLAESIENQKSSTAIVEIIVLDINDNYPQFDERTYTVHVPEDINWIKNPVIAEVKAYDADAGNNAAIRYTLIGGNTRGHFRMDGVTGDISVVAPLDYEAFRSYRLVVRAQDGGSPARSNTTQILVKVVDKNDNDPRFYTSLFQESVMENVDKDHGIVQVQAFDADGGQNGQLKYTIKDAPDNMPITIDSVTGWISTSRELDREEGSLYRFSVVATDNGHPSRSASASVVVTVQDINDNDPVFNPKVYRANVAEDSNRGSPVISVTASDPDENSKIFYQITKGNDRGKFSIISQNKKGLISLAFPLDYKQEKRYVITVTATDSGGRYDTAIVYINVTDANTHRPTFVQTPYAASIPEDVLEGSPVLVVEATDGDVGENARITYTIDDDKVFRIDSSTGAITTVALLNREKVPGYTISVTARDNGNPPQSDTTDVEIVVTDVNDNAPTFSQSSYASSIRENIGKGTSIVTIRASDPDHGLNGRIRYTFNGGYDGNGAFSIDSTSGIIRNSEILDRESKALYDLVAYAVDLGQPSMSSSVNIQVKVDDENDNPPRFESSEIRLYIAENSPVGSTVGEITAYDPDEGPNAAIQYSIIDGIDANAFKLTTNQLGAAAITSLIEFDYESHRKKYSFTLRAESDPKRSDVSVEIWVTDVNDNAPVLSDFTIYFNNYDNHFPVGPIGKVPAHDDDVTDKLRYRFSSGNNANILLLNESTGEITPSPGLNTNVPTNAEMEVSVSDGMNEVVRTSKLVVRHVTEDMLLSSVTVRLNEMTERAFLSRLYDYFIDGLRAVFPVPESHIFVFNIQDDTDVDAQILNVSFSIRNPTIYDRQVFLEPQYVQEKVYLNRQTFAQWARVEILPFDDNLCYREPCRNSQVCMSVLKFGNASGFIYSDTMFFRPIYPVHTFACRCPHGFTGMTESYECDIEVNLCYSNPCGVNGTCLRKEGGYTCLCEPGYTGKNCEVSLLGSECHPDICHSDSVCHRTTLDGIHCENCSLEVETEYHTKFCQLTARGFSSNTFITFPSLKQRQRLHLKLSFATRNRNALLLYNGRYNEKHDFISLEIINSSVVFSFSLGVNASQVSAGIEGGVSDGQWHDVTISYIDRAATISIDDCDTAVSIKYGHRLGGYHCANKTIKINDKKCLSCYKYLDLTGPLQIGGLPDLPLHAFQVSQKGYVGCIKDIYVDHELLDLNRPVQDNGTEKGCHNKEDFCRSSPCLNGGSCVNGWGSYMCQCAAGYVGKSCQMSVEEARHFYGNGFLSFNPSLRPVSLPWNVSLSFRTRQRNGLLMKMIFSTDNVAVFQIVDGHFRYNYNEFQIELNSIYIDDGQWHNIGIKWMTAGIWASLDYDQYELIKTTPVTIQSQYVNLVSIGGIESTNETPKYPFFKGCIQDVNIGGTRNAWLKAATEQNVGHGCTLPDPCESNPCPRNSWCLNTWDAYVCQCEPGHIGDKCVGVCKLDPCENGAKCQTTISGYHHNYYLTQKNDQWSQNSYVCDCDALHTGRYCEVSVGQQPCPKNWWGYPVCGPCNCNTENGYNPNCNKTTGQCVCKNSHYQPEGEGNICLPCDCYLTGSLGNECDAVTGQCFCRKGVFGRRCNLCSNPLAEVTVNGCEVVYDRCPTAYSKGMWWIGVAFDTAAIQTCPQGSTSLASRACKKESLWEEADMFNCTSNAFMVFQGQLNQFEEGLLKVNTYLATSLSLALRNAINFTLAEQNVLYGNDVLIISRILHFILEFEQYQTGLNLSHKQDKDFMRTLVEDASFILNPEYKEFWQEIKKRTEYSAEDLLVDFERYGETLVNTKEDSFTNPFQITTDNLVFGLDTVSQMELWSFMGNSTEARKSRYLTTSGAYVRIPKYNNIEMNERNEATNVRALIPLSVLGISEPRGRIISKKTAVISYAIYPTIGQLIPNRFADNVRRRFGIPTAVSSPVFTLTLQAVNENMTLHGKDLSEDVELSFELETPAYKVAPQCVFWDNELDKWSSHGCLVVSDSTSGEVVCSCNHVTSFAFVMDITDIQYFAEETKVQFVVSYFGIVFSLLLLLLALLVLCSLRGLQTNSNTIHKNLVTCIFMVELVFLVALKLRSILAANEFPCKVIAIMLHHFYLSVFAWMFVEGIHLYRMMTELRDINHGQMRFYYCVGYGVPAIIVGLAVGVRADQYGNYFFCWLSIYEGAIWSLVGPICFFIVVTLAIFAMAVSASIQIKGTVTDFGNLRTLLWLGIGLLPLLGATWTLMLLSVNEMNPLLNFFVSGFCALQAIYIFLGYCVFNKKVRKQMRYSWLRMKGEKVPYDASLSGTRTTIASRSALAYTSPFDVVMHRNIGISTSSTTSRSTAKTSSSPYRSDYGESVLRVTNTSTSTSDHRGRKKSASGKRSFAVDTDGATSRGGRRRRRAANGGDTESDSDMSVDRASLDLASSHSSDDEEYDNSINWKKQNQQNFPDVISQSPHKPNNIDNSDYQSISPPYAIPSGDGMNLPVTSPSSKNRTSPLPLNPPLYSAPQWSVPTQMPVSMSVALQRQQKLNGTNPLSLGANAGFNWLRDAGTVHNERPTSLNITEGLEEYSSRPSGGRQYSSPMEDEYDQESPDQLPRPPPEREDSLPPPPASISDDYNYPDYSMSSPASSPSLPIPSNIAQPMSIPPLTTAEISDGSDESNETCV